MRLKDFDAALGSTSQVCENWMPATAVRPFIHNEPGLHWLKKHGHIHGLYPDVTEYSFLSFVANLGHEFEATWVSRVISDSPIVCKHPAHVHRRESVEETLHLMCSGVPVIRQAALWNITQRIYGVPDLLVHSVWLRENLVLFKEDAQAHFSECLQDALCDDCYLILDVKFTTGLRNPTKGDKIQKLQACAAQLRLYAFMLADLQGDASPYAYLITRDGVYNPIPVEVNSSFDELDPDLAAMRDQYVEIKLNGAKYVPWRDDIVRLDLSRRDEPWATAKRTIAEEKVKGGDPTLLYQIGPQVKRELAQLGYSSVAQMRQCPDDVPLEKCKGIGDTYAKRIRAILKSNQNGVPISPVPKELPLKKRFEFFVDFEYFNNLNVDFDYQWPTLEGCEMIFMIGVGWFEEGTDWQFKVFTADAESHEAERQILTDFVAFLDQKTNGSVSPEDTAIYHWSSAEKWQSKRAADRHGLPPEHPLRELPFVDLQKPFLNSPCGVPGALGYGLKEVAKALGDLDSAYDISWPDDLNDGANAMIMGWSAYAAENSQGTKALQLIKDYLEVDCRALGQILRWLRSYAPSPQDSSILDGYHLQGDLEIAIVEHRAWRQERAEIAVQLELPF